MQGKLILVSGLTGAGKTTLIKSTIDANKNLSYLKTYTTRSARDGEIPSLEYSFVSNEEYERLRKSSSNWDHTEFAGNKYGADVEKVRTLLNQGRSVICSITPETEVLNSMSKLYEVKPITIWIDTPKDIAQARIVDDAARTARNENSDIKNEFDYVFVPTNELSIDMIRLQETVASLLI